MPASSDAETGRSGAPLGQGTRASSFPATAKTAPNSGSDCVDGHVHEPRTLTGSGVDRCEIAHPRRTVGERVRDAIGDRELCGQSVADDVEVGGLMRERVHDVRRAARHRADSRVRGACAAASIGEWVPEAARVQLDPVALDRTAWDQRTCRPRPFAARRRRTLPRTRAGPCNRPRIHAGSSTRKQRRLHAGGGRQADLNRLAVRAKRTPRPASAQQRKRNGVLALCRRQLEQT